jgi:hypothetical protein
LTSRLNPFRIPIAFNESDEVVASAEEESDLVDRPVTWKQVERFLG